MNKQTTLMLTFFLLLAIAGVAFGNGNSGNDPVAFAESYSGAIAGAGAISTSEGGDAAGGSAIAKSGDAISEQQQEQANAQELNYTNKQRRQAPGIALVAPNSTAPLLKCIGFGGSNETGSAIIGHCWLQRDLYAEHRAQQHAEAGRFEASAKALCSQRLYRQDFNDKADCRASVVQSLIDQSIPGMSSEEYELIIQTQAERYNRDVTKLSEMLDEATGLKKGK